MPDSKITALTALTAADPANDMFPIVDVSDTSMAASGTTKRISINNLLAASGTATLASATITGAANFNGGALAGYLNGSLMFGSSGNTVNFFGQSSGFAFKESTGVNNLLTINTSGFVFGDGAGGTRMTLNATGLGVGGSPTAKISCAGFSSANVAPDFQINRSSSGTAIQTGPNLTFADGTANNTVALQNSQGRFGIWNYGAGAWNERLSVDANGNCGIGVTPSYKLDTYTTLQGTVTTKQFANRTSNKILVKRFFGITADTALFSVECGTAGAGAMAAFEINVFATGQKSGVSSDRQFYGKWYVTRNLAGTFTITSAFSSGSSGAFTVAASGTSLNVNGIFSVISDGSACVEVTGYIGGRDTVVETALNVTMP